MRGEWRSEHHSGARFATRAHLVVAELAARQDGVVERGQLLALGVSRREIARRLHSRRLIALFPGVYAVGHVHLRSEGRRRAVLLACGPESALSHRSSLAGLDLLEDRRRIWDVTVPPNHARGRSSPKIRLHRALLLPEQVVEHDGIRMTGVARTLVDVAAVERPRLVSRAVDAALQRELYDQRTIDAEIRSGRRGAARLRKVLEERHPDAHLSRSELESRALESLAARGVPRPSVNVWLAGLDVEVDLLWRDEALVVELDGRRYHAHRRKADAERDAHLRAAGLEVRRYGWGDVVSDWMSGDVAARLAK
jgi:hypothetical protein